MHSAHYVRNGISKSRSCLRNYMAIKAKRSPCLCGERSRRRVSCWLKSPRTCSRNVRPKCRASNGACNAMSRNERIEVEPVWQDFLHEIGDSWNQKEVVLVLDLTPFEEHAQVVYVGLLQQTRVLPLAWKVMPGQEKWEEGLWEIVGTLFAQVKAALGEADCTLIADRGLSGLPLIQLCQAQGWHYVLRIKQEELCQPWRHRAWQGWRAACDLVPNEGRSWYGTVRLWQEHALELQLSAVWQTGQQEAWLLISDRAAGRQRVREYRWRMRVESTFQDMKSRGWQWEQSHVRELDHLNRMLLVLFLAFWWLMRLAASCIHNGLSVFSLRKSTMCHITTDEFQMKWCW